jgi:hypothetical protein
MKSPGMIARQIYRRERKPRGILSVRSIQHKGQTTDKKWGIRKSSAVRGRGFIPVFATGRDPENTIRLAQTR